MSRLILLTSLLFACAQEHPDTRFLPLTNLFGRDITAKISQHPLSDSDDHYCDDVPKEDQIKLLELEVPDEDGSTIAEWKVLHENATERLCQETDDDNVCIASEVCIEVSYGDGDFSNSTGVFLWADGVSCALGIADADDPYRASAVCGH